jgi:hypothetical protein
MLAELKRTCEVGCYACAGECAAAEVEEQLRAASAAAEAEWTAAAKALQTAEAAVAPAAARMTLTELKRTFDESCHPWFGSVLQGL